MHTISFLSRIPRPCSIYALDRVKGVAMSWGKVEKLTWDDQGLRFQ